MRKGQIIIEPLYGGGYVIEDHEGRSVRTGSDYEYPSVAEAFGMVLRHKPRCKDRSGTDGSVDCPSCGQGVGAFISQATTYLDRCAEWGKVVADPGYFEGA